ncbi:MAG TPA: hypothetical protein PK263_00525 [bacterium]|nr:hypothetical protein [bacterium]
MAYWLRLMKQMLFREWFLLTLFYLLLGIGIFHNLLQPGVWNFGDSMFPSLPQELVNLSDFTKTTWWDFEFLGYVTIVEGIPRTSFLLTLKILYLIFSNPSTVQFVWWVLLYISTGWSMFLLAKDLLGNKKAAFLSSLIYLLSPWFFDRSSHFLILQAYAVIPLLCLFFLRLLTTLNWKYATYCAFVVFFIIQSHHYLLISVLILSTLLIFSLLNDPKLKTIIPKLKYSSLAFVFSFLLTGFYSFPLVAWLLSQDNAISRAVDYSSMNLPGLHWGRFGTLLNSVRFLGFHSSIFSNIENFLWKIASFVAPTFVLLSFVALVLWLVRRKKGKDNMVSLLPFYVIYIIGVLLSSAATLWQGKLLRLVSFLPSSIDPNYNVLIVCFSSAVLAGSGYILLSNGLNSLTRQAKKLEVAILVLIFASLLFVIKPVIEWKNNIFNQVEFPADYQEVAKIVNSSPISSRIMILPALPSLQHNWSSYVMISAEGYIFNKPSFGKYMNELTVPSSLNFLESFPLLFPGTQSSNAVLGLTNTEYILLMKDIADQSKNILEIEQKLDKIPTLKKDYSSELLSLYKLEGGFVPKIYIPKSLQIFESNLASSIPFLADKRDNRVLFCFASADSSCANISPSEEGKLPKVIFTKINSTKYKVRIEQSDGRPFPLVFSESFHCFWKIYPSSKNELTSGSGTEFYGGGIIEESSKKNRGKIDLFESLFMKPIPEDRHFIANGYANAWMINPNDFGGKSKYEMVIEFWPQRFYHLGVIASILTIFSIAYWFFVRRKRVRVLLK